MTITPVVLKNGKTVAQTLAAAVFMTLQRLRDNDPILLYEAREAAHRPSYRPLGTYGAKLDELSLTEDGVMHDDVRAVILSAIEGEVWWDMRLVSPVKESAA